MSRHETEIGCGYLVRIRATRRDRFDDAMRLCFNGQSATAYAVTPRFGMVFFSWASDSEFTRSEFASHVVEYGPIERSGDGRSMVEWRHVTHRDTYQLSRLPYAMDWKQAADLAWGWVEQAGRPPEPDTDGSNKKAFEISNGEQFSGMIGEHRGALCQILPTWITLGK